MRFDPIEVWRKPGRISELGVKILGRVARESIERVQR